MRNKTYIRDGFGRITMTVIGKGKEAYCRVDYSSFNYPLPAISTTLQDGNDNPPDNFDDMLCKLVEVHDDGRLNSLIDIYEECAKNIWNNLSESDREVFRVANIVNEITANLTP